jgi:hypothetical protein
LAEPITETRAAAAVHWARIRASSAFNRWKPVNGPNHQQIQSTLRIDKVMRWFTGIQRISD